MSQSAMNALRKTLESKNVFINYGITPDDMAEFLNAKQDQVEPEMIPSLNCLPSDAKIRFVLA